MPAPLINSLCGEELEWICDHMELCQEEPTWAMEYENSYRQTVEYQQSLLVHVGIFYQQFLLEHEDSVGIFEYQGELLSDGDTASTTSSDGEEDSDEEDGVGAA